MMIAEEYLGRSRLFRRLKSGELSAEVGDGMRG